MKRIRIGLLIAVFVAGFVAFGPLAEAAKLRIGVHRSISGSFDDVAHRMGYFKQAGLDYTLSHFKQGKLIRNAVIQGNVDVGMTGFVPFIVALSKGAKITGLAVNSYTCGMMWIMVPVNSTAKTLKDLKGKTIASAAGTSSEFALQVYGLPRLGLKKSDFRWLSLKTTERLASLISGNAQAAILVDPSGELAVRKKTARPLSNFCKYDTTGFVQLGNPITLKAHPELYEKYFKGWIRAHQLLKKDPEKYAKAYHASLLAVGSKMDYSVILDVVKRLRSAPKITDELRRYLNDVGKKQIKIGWIKKHPDFVTSKALDDSIYRKVAAGMSK